MKEHPFGLHSDKDVNELQGGGGGFLGGVTSAIGGLTGQAPEEPKVQAAPPPPPPSTNIAGGNGVVPTESTPNASGEGRRATKVSRKSAGRQILNQASTG